MSEDFRFECLHSGDNNLWWKSLTQRGRAFSFLIFTSTAISNDFLSHSSRTHAASTSLSSSGTPSLPSTHLLHSIWPLSSSSTPPLLTPLIIQLNTFLPSASLSFLQFSFLLFRHLHRLLPFLFPLDQFYFLLLLQLQMLFVVFQLCYNLYLLLISLMPLRRLPITTRPGLVATWFLFPYGQINFNVHSTSTF